MKTMALAVLVLLGGQAPATHEAGRRETKHLAIALSVSAARVAPGERVALYADVTPKPSMHVYAPGQRDYVTVSLKITADPAFTAGAPRFPPGEPFYFAPLDEHQLVYSKRFRITTEIALPDGPPAADTLTVKGTLRYQACDDHVCYIPANVPLEWTVRRSAQ